MPLPIIVPGQFVTRNENTLLLDGRPFRFLGNNSYYLQAELAYGNHAAVAETLDQMMAAGLSVTRANAHNDHPPEQDPAVIQIAPGTYRESSLTALDQSIEAARQRNIRLILKLTNNWEAYGGIRRYLEWRLGRTPSPNEYRLFYTDPQIRRWFENYTAMIVMRYRDEPAILAWELGNELRNPSPGTAAELLAWTRDMAAYIKSIDPHHLIADGGEGFDDDPSLYRGLSSLYAVNGSEGCSFHRLAEIPELDMLSYHMYPNAWRMNNTEDAALWIERHEEIARRAGKIAYLGEYGLRAADAERAQVFEHWLREGTVRQRSAGQMLWHLIDAARVDAEGYAVYSPRDAATCDVLRRYSALLE